MGPKSNMTVIVIEEGKLRHEARGTQRHRVKIVREDGDRDWIYAYCQMPGLPEAGRDPPIQVLE